MVTMADQDLKSAIQGGKRKMPDWYALIVKLQHEKAVCRALGYKGLESFVPLSRTRRRWSDRVKEVELPLFSGYVFCRFYAPDRMPVLTTPGVNSIVSFAKIPAPIPEGEINAIKAMVESGLPISPWPFLKQGQSVVIEDGPLRGLQGKLARSQSSWQVVVSVDLLQRSVAVTMDRDLLSITNDRPLAHSAAANF